MHPMVDWYYQIYLYRICPSSSSAFRAFTFNRWRYNANSAVATIPAAAKADKVIPLGRYWGESDVGKK